MKLRMVSWNLAGRPLLDAVADEAADVALLQEVAAPSAGTPLRLVPDPTTTAWVTGGWKTRRWRTAIAQLSDRVTVRDIPTGLLDTPDRQHLAVSRVGTLTAADLFVEELRLVTVVSWYATWEHPPGDSRLLGADGSAHRLLSDLAALLDHDARDRPLLVAGDLNLLHGYGEHGHPYWAERYATVFDRARVMGLEMVGPQAPHGGRQTDPWPDELPIDSRNVPTFHTRGQGPAGATRQLDFVFASRSIAEQVTVTARNQIDDWGPSDHCRIDITLET